MTFSEFLENSNPDHVFSLMCLGALFVAFCFLLCAVFYHVLGRIILQSRNDLVKRRGLKMIEIAGFWNGIKIERSCNVKEKDCMHCPVKSCYGCIKSKVKAEECLKVLESKLKGDDLQ